MIATSMPDSTVTTDRMWSGAEPDPVGGTLIFTPDRDVHGGDWHGAFRPEAEAFAGLHGLPKSAITQTDVSEEHSTRRTHLLSVISQAQDIGLLVFFCHGWSRGLQLGLSIASLPELISTLHGRVRPDLVVALYACSTGRDEPGTVPPEAGVPGAEGGFAHHLADALIEIAPHCRVYAHTTIGHVSKNPNVDMFDATGRQWLIAPHTEVDPTWARLMHRREKQGARGPVTLDMVIEELGHPLGDGEQRARWCVALHDTDLRFRFPLMSLEDIHSAVVDGA